MDLAGAPKGKFPLVSVMVLSMKTTIEKDITIKNEDVDDSRITYKGALPGKYRPLIVGSDVQAEEGEDQDGGGPAQPCQGGCRGRGGSFFSFYFCNSLIR